MQPPNGGPLMINANIGPREDYANLQVTLTRPADGSPGYTASFQILHWRYFEPRTVGIDPARLRTLNADPAAYGQELGKQLFDDQALGDYYTESLAAVQARGDGLRVRISVEPPELQDVLWERIYHPLDKNWLPLGSTAITPFSRTIQHHRWDRPVPVTTRPLRMLVVIASPANLDAFHLDPIDPAERQRLHDLFDHIPELSPVYLESGTAAPPTLNEIRRRLADGVHMVHFLCHGAVTSAGTGLFLEDEHGSVDPVDQDRLVKAFTAVNPRPVFCFLAACESAVRGRQDAMLPLGPALVDSGGLQAAVAMTGKVGLAVAQAFSGQFYVRLLKHGLVDLAVNEARALVQDDWDWGVPVLFSDLEDNQLIDFPIGSLTDSYLGHTDQVYHAVDEAMSAARLEDHGQALVDDLNALIEELSKSHKLLVEVASKFRRTGRDPATFQQNFEPFYYDFKDYYDNQTWVGEKASCGKITDLQGRILPKLAPILGPVRMDQLVQELSLVNNADNDLIRYFGDYLDAMNTVVENIWARVNARDVPGAVELKTDFEAQISPSFQRSKAVFERMSSGVHNVRKA
jgi:hypothetical protein